MIITLVVINRGGRWFIKGFSRDNIMGLNKEWHQHNKMPKIATFEERMKWHIEHNKNCTCHPGFPQKLKEEAQKRGLKL